MRQALLRVQNTSLRGCRPSRLQTRCAMFLIYLNVRSGSVHRVRRAAGRLASLQDSASGRRRLPGCRRGNDINLGDGHLKEDIEGFLLESGFQPDVAIEQIRRLLTAQKAFGGLRARNGIPL